MALKRHPPKNLNQYHPSLHTSRASCRLWPPPPLLLQSVAPTDHFLPPPLPAPPLSEHSTGSVAMALSRPTATCCPSPVPQSFLMALFPTTLFPNMLHPNSVSFFLGPRYVIFPSLLLLYCVKIVPLGFSPPLPPSLYSSLSPSISGVAYKPQKKLIDIQDTMDATEDPARRQRSAVIRSTYRRKKPYQRPKYSRSNPARLYNGITIQCQRVEIGEIT